MSRDVHHTFTVVHHTFKNVYNLDSLENYLQWSSRDIERMKKVIEETELYQEAVREHIALVSSTETTKEVILKRTVTLKGKVEFFVYIRHVPNIKVNNNVHLYIKTSDNMKFEGRKRKEALAYANELAAIHSCEIKRQGFRK